MTEPPHHRSIDPSPLIDAGIEVVRKGQCLRIGVQSTWDVGCMSGLLVFALIVGILGAVVAWLFGAAFTTNLTIGLVVGGVAVLGLGWLGFRHVHPVWLTVDPEARTMVIPAHSFGPREEFSWSDVESIGVDWSRGHGQRAAPDAPITHIGMTLACQDLGPSINPRLRPEQSRVLVQWMHRELFPGATLGQLDPDPE